MEKATIKFKTGEIITADVNGSCFIVDEKPEFPFDLSEIEITTGEEKKTLNNVEIMDAASVDGRYWFALREMSQEELRQIQIRADIEYLSMMMDIEI